MKNTEVPAIEEWIVNMAELVEMAKLSCLISDKIVRTFIKFGNLLWTFFWKSMKMVIAGFIEGVEYGRMGTI